MKNQPVSAKPVAHAVDAAGISAELSIGCPDCLLEAPGLAILQFKV